MRNFYRGKTVLRTISFFWIILFVALAKSQYGPDDILMKIRTRMDSVKDYSAEINVSVDIPRLRMPDKKGQVYFKQPDKFAVKTSGFAIVPKMGLLPAQTAFITDNSEMTIKSSPKDNGDNAYIIDVRPRDSKVAMTSSIWVNAGRWTIDKVLLEVPDAGKTIFKIHYRKLDGVWLPDTTTVYLNMERSIPVMQRPSVEFPVGYAGGRSGDEPMSGTIHIRFKNYRLNQGISDDIFSK